MNIPKHIPPQLAQRILLRVLRDDLVEEVTGDLDEKFYATLKNKSLFKSKLNYWYQVFNYLRPFAIRKLKSTNVIHYAMYKSYFRIGFRNLLRNKGYSFINIGGLAVGIAVAMLIGLWVYDELSFDKYHHSYDRVARVMQHQTFNGSKGTQSSVPIPLGAELQKSYADDFKYVALSSHMGDHILSFGENKLSRGGAFMDVDAPRLLDLKMIQGTLDGLKEPGSIMLSQSVAKALFGEKDPLNELMRIDNNLDVKVTGVYEDLPFTSTLNELTFLAPWKLYITSEPWIKKAMTQWGNNSFQLLAQIEDGANMEKVNARIKDVKFNVGDESEKSFKPEIFLHPMKDWHLRSNWDNGTQKGGLIQYVWLFAIVGIFVLLLACINFMNLSTARSEQRAKEVGIRKSIGSVRSQLIGQFLSESFLVVFIAFVLAIALAFLFLPWFNQLADKRIVLPLSNLSFWMIGAGFILCIGFLSGSYPALYLSSFHPVKVLKGTFRVGRFASIPRKVLVVVQFTVSVTLIIGTIVVYHQIQYTKNRPLGFDRSGIVMIPMRSLDFYGKSDLLKNELKQTGAITEMAQSFSPLTAIWATNGGFDWEGKDPGLHPEFATVWVTHDFGKTVGWEIKEGRDFSRDFPSDSSGIVLNEAAVKFMGLKNPLGQTIRWHRNDFRVVGVVKDLLMESPFKPVYQTIYLMSYESVNWIVLKLNPEKSITESIAAVETVFKKHIPTVPFEYKFADVEHAHKFASEVRIGKLSGVFAALAVFISCLGLFGLASFVAEQRTKEIGIRKVLGASVANVWRMLSKDFVMLVMISSILAIPIAYYTMNNWLQAYDYRTEISSWIFIVSILGAFTITLLTVSYQAIKAATMNPVNSLKNE